MQYFQWCDAVACVTIDVCVLGETLGELPEFADVVCARHGVEDADWIEEVSVGGHAWILISIPWVLDLAVDYADLTDSAQNVVSTNRRPAC